MPTSRCSILYAERRDVHEFEAVNSVHMSNVLVGMPFKLTQFSVCNVIIVMPTKLKQSALSLKVDLRCCPRKASPSSSLRGCW
ncbi:hypothetical protein BaRGS_00002147 [Batillaria attramentaria]|uniref:Uncharacterized protein n=1 Tax=Batillaria attramentaria TaxID=370345 RepID=A0ABD0M4Y6_9CAEN